MSEWQAKIMVSIARFKSLSLDLFSAIHVIVVYLWLAFSEGKNGRLNSGTGNAHRDGEYESSFEEYRGYKKHRSNLINHLRATLVSFLFPPTCSWHLQDLSEALPAVRKPSSMHGIRRGLPRQFWVMSGFQFVESCVLFGVWLYLHQDNIKIFYQILVPSVSLFCLLIRPFCDVLCQMVILTPIAQREAAECTRFRGWFAWLIKRGGGGDTKLFDDLWFVDLWGKCFWDYKNFLLHLLFHFIKRKKRSDANHGTFPVRS